MSPSCSQQPSHRTLLRLWCTLRTILNSAINKDIWWHELYLEQFWDVQIFLKYCKRTWPSAVNWVFLHRWVPCGFVNARTWGATNMREMCWSMARTVGIGILDGGSPFLGRWNWAISEFDFNLSLEFPNCFWMTFSKVSDFQCNFKSNFNHFDLPTNLQQTTSQQTDQTCHAARYGYVSPENLLSVLRGNATFGRLWRGRSSAGDDDKVGGFWCGNWPMKPGTV